MTIEHKLEHKVEMAEHFGIEPFDGSALAQAVDYLVEGESSSDYIKTYARGYAELAERFHLAQSAEITAERDRLREWVNRLNYAQWGKVELEFLGETWAVLVYETVEGNHSMIPLTAFEGKTPYEALTAYLKGKGDGDKGE